jgi:hypothetical protein
MRAVLVSSLVLLLVSCGDDDSGPSDASVDARPFGCPSHPDPLAMPGDDLGGDTWETFASGFFETYCTRCHSSELVGDVARAGAPEGLNWDVEATVRENLELVRFVVGESNEMPPRGDRPTCGDRERLVRWIDADAP